MVERQPDSGMQQSLEQVLAALTEFRQVMTVEIQRLREEYRKLLWEVRQLRSGPAKKDDAPCRPKRHNWATLPCSEVQRGGEDRNLCSICWYHVMDDGT